MPTLSYFDPWLISYKNKTERAVSRSRFPGKMNQRKNSHRKTDIVNAERILQGIQAPYLEYFIREVCEDGHLKFTDYYADGSGTSQGLVRIVDGAYKITPLGNNNYSFECELEIFR